MTNETTPTHYTSRAERRKADKAKAAQLALADKDNKGGLNVIRRHPRAAAGVAIGALATGAAIVWAVTRGPSDGPTPGQTTTSEPTAGPTPGETDGSEVQSLEQELAQKIEQGQLKKEDIEINVADYGSLKEAVYAWWISYFTCVTTGNIELSPDNELQYYGERQDPLEIAIPRDFQLDRNQATCSDALMDGDAPNVTEFIDATNALNDFIVIKEFTGSDVELVSNGITFGPVNDTEAEGTIDYNVNVSNGESTETTTSTIGFDLKVDANNLLKWSPLE